MNRGGPWDFFALVSLAVAMVEEHMAQQGYYHADLEQRTLRRTWETIRYAADHHPHLLPSFDLDGLPLDLS